jgi:hypothetical protein
VWFDSAEAATGPIRRERNAIVLTPEVRSIVSERLPEAGEWQHIAGAHHAATITFVLNRKVIAAADRWAVPFDLPDIAKPDIPPSILICEVAHVPKPVSHSYRNVHCGDHLRGADARPCR